MLDISVKTFNQLTLDELYYLLQLRSEVFVVEQDLHRLAFLVDLTIGKPPK